MKYEINIVQPSVKSMFHKIWDSELTVGLANIIYIMYVMVEAQQIQLVVYT